MIENNSVPGKISGNSEIVDFKEINQVPQLPLRENYKIFRINGLPFLLYNALLTKKTLSIFQGTNLWI